MKIDYQGETVYITYLCTDTPYVLVTKDKNKNSGFFKVNLIDLPDITEDHLIKLEKFKK